MRWLSWKCVLQPVQLVVVRPCLILGGLAGRHGGLEHICHTCALSCATYGWVRITIGAGQTVIVLATLLGIAELLFQVALLVERKNFAGSHIQSVLAKKGTPFVFQVHV